MENINSYDELKQKLGQNELETLISNEYFFDSNSIFNFFEDTEFKTPQEFADFDFCYYLDHIYDNLIVNLQYNIEKKYKLDVNDDVIEQLVEEFLVKPFDSKEEKIFNRVKEQYMESNVCLDNDKVKFSDLSDIDDFIGDTQYLFDDERIDYDSREVPVVYLNGELLVGEKNETHTQVIQEYIDSFDEDDDFYRMDEEQLNEMGFNDVVFAHLLDDVVIADEIFGNVSVKKFSQQCKSELGVDKVYFFDGTYVTRLAKYKKFKD